MDPEFEDSQFQFLNWLRGNNSFHGGQDCWRLNSFSFDNSNYLTENMADSELLGINRSESVDVKGRMRSKYFYHLTGQAPKFTPLPLDSDDSSSSATTAKETHRDVGVQTKYRESSAQTSPFEPDFIVDAKGKYLNLEIYSICRAIQGFSEPGMYEITMIERLRRRRVLEKILNTAKGRDEVEKYRRAIETFEWEEWIGREEDIEYYQNLRMQMVRELLDEKNAKMRRTSDDKVMQRLEQIKKDCAAEMAKIQSKYNRNMRKLEYKRRNINRRYQKTDVLTEHIRKDSELYAPQMRNGVNPKRRHFVGYRTKFDLCMEDAKVRVSPSPVVVPCPFAFVNRISKPKEPPKEYTTSFMTDKRLKDLYESLKYFRLKLEPKRDSPKCLVEKKVAQKDKQMKATVFGVEQDIQAEEEYQKCIFLQKLIKGRATQSILYAGKEEFKGLIHEIESTHALQAVEMLFPEMSRKREAKKAATLANQKYQEQVMNDNINLRNIVRDFEGSIVGPLFEFLEKELDRLYEQKRVQAIVMLAERERYKREAKEAGTRQHECRLRDQYVEAYTHMAKATKDTITTYLEDVLLEEVNLKASIDGRRKIATIARDLDKFGDEMIERPTLNVAEKRSNEEAMITDIVDNFLFSNVHNQLARQRIDKERKKRIEAINKSLYAEFRIAENVLGDILTDIIDDVVQAKSPTETTQEEPLKQYIHGIIEHIFDDTLNEPQRTFQHIMNEILGSIFSSDHYSVLMDSREKKDYVINVIIKELKEQIGYELKPDDKCFLEMKKAEEAEGDDQ